MTKKTNPDFLNGVPELLILQLLERCPLYGYDLVQAIHDASGHKLVFGEGCIYPVLHRLEAQKLLSSRILILVAAWPPPRGFVRPDHQLASYGQPEAPATARAAVPDTGR